MIINNGVSPHYNHSCLILRICVWVYGAMDTMFPPLLILSISDLSTVGKYILNGEELLLLPLFLEPLSSFIYGHNKFIDVFSPLLYISSTIAFIFVLVLFLLS